jgi:Family of unknown function (DUF6502)
VILNDMPAPQDTDAPIVRPDQLHAPLARLLRPLVRLLIRTGVTFPALQDMLRELYVNVAEYDFALPGKEQTDSRVSLLTGIHRKEVRRLRGAGAPVSAVPATISRGGQIIARWLGAPGYQDKSGRPLALPRSSSDAEAVSFETLVRSVTVDVRPRAVLDEWLAHGMVTADDEGQITLAETAYLERKDGAALAYYFGRNLAFHMSAATANLEGAKAKFLERAVNYDGLSEKQAVDLEAYARSLALQALKKANAKALSMLEASKGTPPKRNWSWNFGLYVCREPNDTEGKQQ